MNVNFEKIDKNEKINQFQASVIAFFDFRNGANPPGYSNFYWTSMKSLEHDPQRSIGVQFGVIAKPSLALEMNFTSSRQIRLYQLTEDQPLVYPTDREFKSKSIADWIYSSVRGTPFEWVPLNAQKDVLFDTLSSNGPTVILLAPQKPMIANRGANAAAQIFYETALTVQKTCNKSAETKARIQAAVGESRRRRAEEILRLRALLKKCNTKKSENIPEILENENSPDPVLSQGPGPGSPIKLKKNKEKVKGTNRYDYSYDCARLETAQSLLYRNICVVCERAPAPDCSMDEKKIVVESNFPPAPFCLRFKMAKRYHYELPAALAEAEVQAAVAPRNIQAEFEKNWEIFGAGCKLNRTLNFIAIDSAQHPGFGDSLGLKRGESAVVILDRERQENFVLTATLTDSNLGKFFV